MPLHFLTSRIGAALRHVFASAVDEGSQITGNREVRVIRFSGPISAQGVIERLTAHLDEQRIAYSSANGVELDDTQVAWRAAPGSGGDTIEVWIEARDALLRRQFLAGMDQYLTRDLGLRLL